MMIEVMHHIREKARIEYGALPSAHNQKRKIDNVKDANDIPPFPRIVKKQIHPDVHETTVYHTLVPGQIEEAFNSISSFKEYIEKQKYDLPLWTEAGSKFWHPSSSNVNFKETVKKEIKNAREMYTIKSSDEE